MKEKYHIYNYLKNHESALIALASGTIGIIIMALNFVLYITDRFYLSQWNCHLIPVENSPSRFYSLCIWFVYFAAYMFLGKVLGKASIEFQNDVIELNHVLSKLKEQKKLLKVEEKKLKKIKKTANKDENNSDIIEIEQLVDEAKLQHDSIKSEAKKLKNKLEIKTIVKILFLAIIYSIPITLIKYIQTFEFTDSLKTTFSTIGMLLFFLIPISLIIVNVLSTKISQKSTEFKFIPNDSLSDSMIIKYCKNAVWIFVFVVAQILFNAFVENLSKKDFEIFSIENQKYASIYESEHYLIGEKISYTDSTITFYLNNQIIVEKNNISIVKRKFEKIEKVDTLKTEILK